MESEVSFAPRISSILWGGAGQSLHLAGRVSLFFPQGEASIPGENTLNLVEM